MYQLPLNEFLSTPEDTKTKVILELQGDMRKTEKSND